MIHFRIKFSLLDVGIRGWFIFSVHILKADISAFMLKRVIHSFDIRCQFLVVVISETSGICKPEDEF